MQLKNKDGFYKKEQEKISREFIFKKECSICQRFAIGLNYVVYYILERVIILKDFLVVMIAIFKKFIHK